MDFLTLSRAAFKPEVGPLTSMRYPSTQVRYPQGPGRLTWPRDLSYVTHSASDARLVHFSVSFSPSRDGGRPPYTTQPITLTWLLTIVSGSRFDTFLNLFSGHPEFFTVVHRTYSGMRKVLLAMYYVLPQP